MKSMFDAHKKDPLPPEQAEVIQDMKDSINIYTSDKENPDRAKLTILAKQIGLNIKELSDDEVRVLIKSLQRSDKFKKAKGARKRK